MSVIESVQTYIAAYASLKAGAPLWVDNLDGNATEYSISPLAGSRIVATDLAGNTEREFAFAFSSTESTADDLERVANIGFYENFAEWLESQTEAGTLPTLDSGKTATKIEALGWGYLYAPGESGTGIYQIQCKLTYEQDAP